MAVKKVKKDGTIHITKKEMEKIVDKQAKLESITQKITKTFEKEEWVQNEYWENDNGVLCASFINIDLDQISVFVDVE
jgi:methionine aminopeptidase